MGGESFEPAPATGAAAEPAPARRLTRAARSGADDGVHRPDWVVDAKREQEGERPDWVVDAKPSQDAPAPGAGRGARSGGRRTSAGTRTGGARSGGTRSGGERGDAERGDGERGRRSGREPGGGRSRERGAGGRARATDEVETDPAARARDICLRLLTGNAKTRKQLADALRKREIPDEVAEQVLGRFEEVGLIDDAAFAAAWVESRHAGRGLARRALAQELRTRGVAGAVVEEAVAQLDPEDEAVAARALVERKLRSTAGLERQARMRRLVGMLARRGYPQGVAFRVVREALDAAGESSEELEDWSLG
ncbi:hypothetical protein GCM10009665_62210 [Kitasatospora nipponensis]|uniref:Regulatory protein RecX n=1 Tax=Kitasatospora nipponensis TaxID=258049 RepID=A0ABN1WVD8_9ACTN